ncbi:hypothetical protein C0992_002815 [Termitomyces sp. T32_za158]|nr:hypothetical protein C0992_002815 [Termitomyces sp. T32_za158]
MTNTASGTSSKQKANGVPLLEFGKKILQKKKKSQLGSAFETKWLEASKVQNTKAIVLATVVAENEEDEDSLMRMGGFLEDNKDDRVEKAAIRKAGNAPQPQQDLLSMVRIAPSKYMVTMMELRGGKKKWNLNHLPWPALLLPGQP